MLCGGDAKHQVLPRARPEGRAGLHGIHQGPAALEIVRGVGETHKPLARVPGLRSRYPTLVASRGAKRPGG